MQQRKRLVLSTMPERDGARGDGAVRARAGASRDAQENAQGLLALRVRLQALFQGPRPSHTSSSSSSLALILHAAHRSNQDPCVTAEHTAANEGEDCM